MLLKTAKAFAWTDKVTNDGVLSGLSKGSMIEPRLSVAAPSAVGLSECAFSFSGTRIIACSLGWN